MVDRAEQLLLGQRLSGRKTVIAVLHDLNHALQYADEIVLMENLNLKFYCK